MEPQDLCQAVPRLFWGERNPSRQRICLRERVGNEGAFIERGVVIAEGHEGRLSSVTSLAISRHGTRDRRGVEPPGQTHTDGNVAPQPNAHGVLEQLREPFFDIGDRLRLEPRERPIGPLSPLTIEPELERASRWDLVDAGEERRRGLIQLAVDEEVGSHAPVRLAYVEPRSEDGLHL